MLLLTFIQKYKRVVQGCSIILGIVLFYFNFYVLGMYPSIFSVLVQIGLENLQYSKPTLELKHSEIEKEVLPDMFQLEIHHFIFGTIFLGVFFFFNIMVGIFYLLFILFGLAGAYFQINIYKFVPKRFYNYVKTFKTILISYDTLFRIFNINKHINL